MLSTAAASACSTSASGSHDGSFRARPEAEVVATASASGGIGKNHACAAFAKPDKKGAKDSLPAPPMRAPSIDAMAMGRNERDLPPGIVRCGEAAWATRLLTRTLGADEIANYAETCFSCVTCAYYQQRLCGNEGKMPKLWIGEEFTHVHGQKHQTAARGVTTSLPLMADWLEAESVRLGMQPPGPGAAPAAAESPVGASSAPVSVSSQERVQALEDAVSSLQGQCADLRRRNDDLNTRMNQMTGREGAAGTYYAQWWGGAS